MIRIKALKAKSTKTNTRTNKTGIVSIRDKDTKTPPVFLPYSTESKVD
jgi:hypothetical protein